MSLAVLKFGGTSVGDASAMRQTAAIIASATRQFEHVVVVTSAMGKSPDPNDTVKVTDTLLNAARTAAEGDAAGYTQARRDLAGKHRKALDAAVTNTADRAAIFADVSALLDGFEMLCASIRVLGEATPRALDVIAGLGERIAARVLAGVLRSTGVNAEFVDATDLIVTDERYQSATPIMDLTRAKTLGKIGVVIGQQNSEHFRTVDDVNRFYGLGQRVSQLTYRRNPLGGGSTDANDAGLTPFGARIIERMWSRSMAKPVGVGR